MPPSASSAAQPVTMRYSRALVAARIVEPASELDRPRVLEDAGMEAPQYATAAKAACG